MRWDGRELRRGEAIPAAQEHYLKHVRFFGEWPEPPGVSDAARLPAWIDNLREVVRDPTGGLLLSRYQDKGWGLAVVRQSRELRGPGGFDWVVIQYRLETGHWVTAFQAARGLDYFDEPSWQDKRWLRPPT